MLDAETGEQLRVLYRKDLSGGGSNIMVRKKLAACARPTAACGCLCMGGRLTGAVQQAAGAACPTLAGAQLPSLPRSSQGAALAEWLAKGDAREGDFIALRARNGGLEMRLMPAGGRGVKRRRSSSEEREAAAAGSQGGGGSKQPRRAGKGKQPAAAGQAAQRAERAGGAGAAAPQGVESELQGEALLQRRIEGELRRAAHVATRVCLSGLWLYHLVGTDGLACTCSRSTPPILHMLSLPIQCSAMELQEVVCWHGGPLRPSQAVSLCLRLP